MRLVHAGSSGQVPASQDFTRSPPIILASLAAFQDPALSSTLPARVRALAGVALIVAVAWGLSTDRKRVSWRLVAWGLGLQIVFAFIVLRTPVGIAFFEGVNGVVRALLGYAEEGGRFIFGNPVSDNIPVGQGDPGQGSFTPTQGMVAQSGAFFAFRIFPNIIFTDSIL